MTDYTFWKASIAGEKPKMFVDDPQPGFYRKSINQRSDKGNNRRVGWQPVAVFMDGETITARLGNEQTGDDVTGDRLNELWSYIAGNAIIEEWYRAVAREGRDWPDAHDPKKNRSPAVREDGSLCSDCPPVGDEYDGTRCTPCPRRRLAPSIIEESPEAKLARKKPPEQKLLDELAEHAKGIPTYAKIEDDLLLSKAHDLRDKIKKVENAAEAERKKEKDFYLKKGREIDDKWRGVITTAKARYDELSTPMNAWINEKLEAQRLHDERVAEDQRKHDAAVAAAEAANKPAPAPPPPPPAPNLPAPSMQVRSGGGARASNIKVNKIVTITDEAAVYKHFAGSLDLTAVLLKLATTAINNNLAVPGTTWKPEAKV